MSLKYVFHQSHWLKVQGNSGQSYDVIAKLEESKSINDFVDIFVNCENITMSSIMSNCFRNSLRIYKPQERNYQITAVVLTLNTNSGPSNLVNSHQAALIITASVLELETHELCVGYI